MELTQTPSQRDEWVIKNEPAKKSQLKNQHRKRYGRKSPRWAFLALSLPTLDEPWCERFMGGFLALAGRHGVDLAGGDTTRGPRNLCVTVVGECVPGAALRRDGARAGDDIHLSGVVGEAAAGLQSRRRLPAGDAADVEHCRPRLDRPEPRVMLGRALAGVAHAAIDVSDGLLGDR